MMNKKFSFIKNPNGYIQQNIIAIVISIIISFVFLLNSPLHPWICSDTGTDSSVFKTVALMMENGFMPYKDTFDHKGPLIYIINWIGNQLFEYWGVWIIEFLFMMVTVFMLYKTACLLCKRNSAIITVFTAFSLLFPYFEGGNFTEEYAMAFISVATFIFLDYLKNNKISKPRLIICGFSFGGTLLLRPNMAAIWIVMCTAIFIRTIVDKDWEKLKGFIIWFVLGMAVIIVPIILWLGINDSLIQCWNDYIVFNKEYTSKEGGLATFSAKWNSFFTFFGSTIYIIAVFSIILIGKLRNHFINIIYSIYMFITLLLICMSGMTYGHYGMILIPVVVYPLSLAFSEIEKIEIQDISRAIVLILSIYLLGSIIATDWYWLALIKAIPSTYEARDIDHRSEVIKTVTEIIENNSSTDDSISVYGNWDLVYVCSGRRHATRYSYQFPIGEVMPRIMDEYMQQMQEELPKLIIIQAGYYDDNIIKFLDDYEYQLLWSQNGESLDGVLIYIRAYAPASLNSQIGYENDYYGDEKMMQSLIEEPECSEGAEQNVEGSYTFKTYVVGNQFSSIVLQIYNLETGEPLSTVCTTSSNGVSHGIYTHELESGQYLIQLRANSNLSDEYIEQEVYLEKEQAYEYAFDVINLARREARIDSFIFRAKK